MKRREDGTAAVRAVPVLVVSAFLMAFLFAIPYGVRAEGIYGTVTGASVDESNITRTYYVDASAGSSGGTGAAGSPFNTITSAVTKALAHNKDDEGTRIIVRSGVYRESLKLIGRGRSNSAPIIIEGDKKGQVFVKGSIDYSKGWSQEGNLCVRDWNYKWGASADIYAEEYNIFIDEIVRRREMIFIDGKHLIPVMQKSALVPGTYFASESEGRIYMRLPAGKQLGKCLIELPVMERVVEIFQIRHIVIRNIEFSQINCYQASAGFSIYQADNVMIENSSVNQTNCIGIGVHVARDVTLRNLTINENGGGGIVGSSLDNVLIKNCETSRNNWRGALGKYYDWDTGGIKILFSYDIRVEGHKAIDNLTPGIWFDSECRRITIIGCDVRGNTSPGDGITAGIYLEGGIGPYLVKDCMIVGNRRGFNIASANDVHIQNCVIADNWDCQINLYANNGLGRTFKARGTNTDVTALPIGTVIENTVISVSDPKIGPMFHYDHNDPGAYILWFKNLTTKKLQYYHANASKAFFKRDVRTLGSFQDWKEMTGLDSDAVWLGKPYDVSLGLPGPAQPGTSTPPATASTASRPAVSSQQNPGSEPSNDGSSGDTGSGVTSAAAVSSDAHSFQSGKKTAGEPKNPASAAAAIVLGALSVAAAGLIATAGVIVVKNRPGKSPEKDESERS